VSDNVYFNPKKAAEGVKQELLDEIKAQQKSLSDYEMGQKVLVNTVQFFLAPVALMFLWNWIMPGLFGLATIGYLKAWGLHAMSRILFYHHD
tara:strand:+ start:9041 stop:9316 length:276 start_codon:yes stop_codon:yes gene_type:complete